MKKLIDFDSYPVRTTLQILLKDKTTKNNIIWATDAYAERGHGFQDIVKLLCILTGQCLDSCCSEKNACCKESRIFPIDITEFCHFYVPPDM